MAGLVGTWRGRGIVSLPATAPREYVEVVRFSIRSPTSLDYWQRATSAVDGTLLHSESGLWRVTGTGSLEISVALPGGTEVSEGTIDETTVVLASTAIGRATTGARLVATARRYELRGDAIAYEIGITTERFPIPRHLIGDLRRSTEVG